jgi:2-amino-4-hydroxy-6-hydroxymethyldihydropteridine diphosphokinase
MALAYIGLGANMPSAAGPPEATLVAAVERMDALGRITARSSLYSTAPVGFADQPRFVNGVVALKTALQPRALLDALMKIEQEFGRDRSQGIPNGPRVLDLDILLLEDVYLNEPGLEVPHPRLAERAFVLVPLNEIAPTARDPRTGTTVAQWLQHLIPVLSDTDHEVIRLQSNVWLTGADGPGPSRTVGGYSHG